MPNDNGRKIKELLVYLTQFGWSHAVAQNGHWKVAGPDGQKLQLACSPSDPRAFLNIRARLSRAGAPVPRR